jgi:hypothetical protein
MVVCERCRAHPGEEDRDGPILCPDCRAEVIRAGRSPAPVVLVPRGCCRWCHRRFEPVRAGDVYCGPRCRRAAWSAGVRAESDRRLAARL